MRIKWLRSLAIGLVALPAVALHAQSRALADGMGTLFGIADSNNTSVQAFRTALEQADHDVAAARAQRLPDVKADLSFSYIGNAQLWDRHFGDFMSASMPHWGNNFTLQAMQTVYSGGAITGGIRLAELGREMQRLGDEANRHAVRIMIAGLYLDLHSIDNRMEVVEKNIALTDTLILHTRDRHREGVVLKNDITRYELMREQMSLQATVLQNQKSVAEKRLRTALALKDGDKGVAMLPQEAFDIADVPAEEHWQALALASNSGLKQAATEVDMSRYREKIARAGTLPKVTIVAEDHLDGPILTEVPPINRNLNYWFVGVGVSYNISSLYKNNRRIRSAEKAVRHAEQRREVAKESVGDNIHAAYTALQTARTELRTREKSMELARQNYDVIANRYNEGLAMVTDMTDAANVRLDAEQRFADARIAVAAALYQLKYIAGDL